MTLPKSTTLNKIIEWLAPKAGAAALAIIGAGLLALASQWFVTHEAMAKDVLAPLSAEVAVNKEQAEQLAVIARSAAALEVEKRAAAERLAAEKAANDERDKVIRSLVDTTRTLADEVRVQADKTRVHEAQIVSLQAATAGVRTEIAVVQANQVAAAKQSDRIEDKLDRLIETRSAKP
jgi:hypothetical protein